MAAVLTVVGKAKGQDILIDNGVYFGSSYGLPWYSRPIPSGVFTLPVKVLGSTKYVDPKNRGIIPWEHEWTRVDPILFDLAKESGSYSKIKSQFKKQFEQKTMVQANGDSATSLGGIGGSVLYAIDPLKPKEKENPVIPRTYPKENKSYKWVWVVIIIAFLTGGLYLVFRKK